MVCAGLEERILPYEDGLEKSQFDKKAERCMDDDEKLLSRKKAESRKPET